jgi:hypothetical protein
MKTGKLILLAMLVAIPANCSAQDYRWTPPDWTFDVNSYFKRVERYERRQQHIRQAWREREYEQRNDDYRYDDRRNDWRGGQECRDMLQAVGEERYGRDRAKESAEQQWMEAARNRYGVRWMDLRNSRGGTWECGRSSTGNRAMEKAADVAGRFLEQCVLRSRPCRAELERVSKD